MKHEILETLLRADPIAIELLKAVAEAGPEGAYIGAGFLRNRVWDNLYDDGRSYPEADIDVIYFCAENDSPETDYAFEARLREYISGYDWQVRNQARMHHFGGHAQFISLENGLKHWAETATTVSVRLKGEELDFIAPFGFGDLMNHILKITPIMQKCDPKGFESRLTQKGWLKRWPDITVIS